MKYAYILGAASLAIPALAQPFEDIYTRDAEIYDDLWARQDAPADPAAAGGEAAPPADPAAGGAPPAGGDAPPAGADPPAAPPAGGAPGGGKKHHGGKKHGGKRHGGKKHGGKHHGGKKFGGMKGGRRGGRKGKRDELDFLNDLVTRDLDHDLYDIYARDLDILDLYVRAAEEAVATGAAPPPETDLSAGSGALPAPPTGAAHHGQSHSHHGGKHSGKHHAGSKAHHGGPRSKFGGHHGAQNVPHSAHSAHHAAQHPVAVRDLYARYAEPEAEAEYDDLEIFARDPEAWADEELEFELY